MLPTPLLDKLAPLCEQGTLQHFTKGELILRTDHSPPGVFCVKTGYIKVYSITEAGDENLHIFYGPDTIFPLIWLVTGRLRQVFYEAMGDVSLYRIDRQRFLSFIAHNPAVAGALLRRVVDMFNIYADRIDNLEYTRSRARIVYRLLRLAEEVGTPHGSGVLLLAPLTHHDIARSSNCSRETASRELEQLQKKGLITYQNQHILLTDISRLEKELVRS